MKIVWRALIGALCLVLFLTACGSNKEEEAAIAAGQDIFETGGAVQIPCMTCHSLDGTTLVGPSLQGISERAATRIDGVAAEDYIRQSIQQPWQFVAPGYSDAMPKTYGERLSEEDVDHLVAFLMTQ
jgi:cytochrome c2